MTGIHAGVAAVLIRLHRIETVKDANDYIKRLNGVEHLFDQVIDGLKTRAGMGIVAPRFVYERAIESVRKIIIGQPFEGSVLADSPLFADFKRKVDALDVTPEQKLNLQVTAQQALLDSLGPAYRKLIDVFDCSQRSGRGGGRGVEVTKILKIFAN